MKNTKIFNFSIIFISILVILLSIYLSRNVSFYGDDIWLGLYLPNEKIPDSLYKTSAFNTMHGGGYFCFFLTKFFNFGLPNILNIHPGDFMSYGIGLFKGIINMIIFLLLSKIVFNYVKSRKIFIGCFLFTAGYFFWTLYNIHTPIMSINHLYNRYVLPILFFILFWQYIYNNIKETNNKTNYIHLVLISICGFLISTGIEILMYSSILLISILIIYNQICKLTNRKDLSFSLKKEFYIPSIISYISLIVYNLSPAYRQILADRNIDNFLTNINYIKEFTHVYFNLYIEKNLLTTIFFIIFLIIGFYFAYKNKEIQKIIFPFFLQISIILTYFSLLFSGKSHYDYNDFWLYSPQLQFLYHIIILYSLCILFGYTIKNIKNIIEKKKIDLFINTVFISLIFLSMMLILFKPQNLIYYIKNIDLNPNSTITKERQYMSEKILRFYYLKNQIPYLPTQFNNTDDLPNVPSAFIWLYRFEGYKQNPCSNSEDILFTSIYYTRIYKDKIAAKTGYCFSDDALQKFYQDGGIFTKNELNYIIFTRLMNNEFIIRNKSKEDIITPEEIIKKAQSQF